MSYRELWVFIAGLPQDSLTQTRLRDSSQRELAELVAPEPAGEQRFGPWALLNYQIAVLTDAVHELTYITKVAAGLKDRHGRDPEPPQPVARPGLQAGRPQRVQSEAAVLYLDRLRAKG